MPGKKAMHLTRRERQIMDVIYQLGSATVGDVQAVVKPALRHRIAGNYAAQANNLTSDRLIHWAVPWLDAAGRCYPSHRHRAHQARDVLLEQLHRQSDEIIEVHELAIPCGQDTTERGIEIRSHIVEQDTFFEVDDIVFEVAADMRFSSAAA